MPDQFLLIIVMHYKKEADCEMQDRFELQHFQ
jgi:hypothetical protein